MTVNGQQKYEISIALLGGLFFVPGRTCIGDERRFSSQGRLLVARREVGCGAGDAAKGASQKLQWGCEKAGVGDVEGPGT